MTKEEIVKFFKESLSIEFLSKEIVSKGKVGFLRIRLGDETILEDELDLNVY